MLGDHESDDTDDENNDEEAGMLLRICHQTGREISLIVKKGMVMNSCVTPISAAFTYTSACGQ